jgi:hypothetical protein
MEMDNERKNSLVLLLSIQKLIRRAMSDSWHYYEIGLGYGCN